MHAERPEGEAWTWNNIELIIYDLFVNEKNKNGAKQILRYCDFRHLEDRISSMPYTFAPV
jgi:hypothetical protein